MFKIKRLPSRWQLLIVVALLFPAVSFASDHYVSPDGQATWSQSTKVSSPTSVNIAMQNAQAGDTVYFRGGVYPAGSAPAYHGYYEPSNSGTIEKPIVFKAYPNEQPVIEATVPADKGGSFVIGTGAHDYIIWDGFILRANDNKSAGFFMGASVDDAHRVKGCEMRNLVIIAGTYPMSSADNADLSRAEKTTHCRIFNCRIGGLKTDVYSDNNAALKLYHNDHLIIENCEFFDSPNGISAKSDLDDSIIRNNYFHGNYKSLRCNVYLTQSSDRNVICSNVFAPSHLAIHVYAEEETAHANEWKVYNNTIYNESNPNSGGLVFGNAQEAGWEIYNNIFDVTGQIGSSKTSHLAGCDHNLFRNPLSIELRVYGTNHVKYTSLEDWQSSTELLDGSSPGAGSLVSNPGFLNASGTMSQLDDFRLSSDSPCRGAGRDGVDMGANIDLVGIKSGTSSGGSPPPSPGNLRKLSQ